MCDSTCAEARKQQYLRELQRHLREFENQFDNAQGNLRTAGSVWTLAGIGGLAGAAALDTSHTYMARHFDGFMPEALMSFVCFLVVIGLANLWSVDQFVYQRLLHSVFGYGMAIEEYLEPHERLRLAVNAHVKDVTGPLSQFYWMPIVVFLVIFGILNAVQSWDQFTLIAGILWLLFFMCVLWTFRLICKSRQDDVSNARKDVAEKIKALLKIPPLALSEAPIGADPPTQ